MRRATKVVSKQKMSVGLRGLGESPERVDGFDATHLIGLHDDAVGLLALLAAPFEGTQHCSHLALMGQNLIANFADQNMYVSRSLGRSAGRALASSLGLSCARRLVGGRSRRLRARRLVGLQHRQSTSRE